MRRPTPRAARGFTLIEVLIAMSIMAIVAVMSWQGVDGIVRARNVVQTRVDLVLRASTVLAQWEQDLDSLQETGGVIPALEFDGARVSMTRRTEGGLQLVVWARRDNAWFRWSSQPVTTVRGLQDVYVSSRQFIGNEAGQLKTLPDLTDWQVYFYRTNAWTNAQSSAGTAAPSAAAAAASGVPQQVAAPLPEAVRIVLTFGGTQGMAGTITRDVATKIK
jgi:general secretion pathway protein J